VIDRKKIYNLALNQTSILLFILLFIIFGLIAPRFLTLRSFQNILFTSSSLGILAVGMTMVLLTGGIDLSLGSNMYLTGVIVGILLNVVELPVWMVIPCALAVGTLYGALNAFVITKLKIVPFVATLGTLLMGRGSGLVISRSKAIDFPPSITRFGSIDLFGVLPLPIFVFVAVVLLFHLLLVRTQFGRQVYAVGNNLEAAQKAGLRTGPIIARVYILCGMLASLASLVSLSQIGRFNPNFGSGIELQAVAAAVLGGTSLFGGIGAIFPGTFLGSIMIPMVQSGLVFVNMDIYIQPMVMYAIVFLAVFIDSVRSRQIAKRERRHIMKKETDETGAA
jgi:ribose transport system permease protein